MIKFAQGYDGTEADALARRALEGADLTLDYRAAGYDTPEAAAEVLLGAQGSESATARALAVEIVAAEIAVPHAPRGCDHV